MLAAAFKIVLRQPNLRWKKEARRNFGRFVDTSFRERAEALLSLRSEIPEIMPVAHSAVKLVIAKIASWELNIEDVTGMLLRVTAKEVEIEVEDVALIFAAIDAHLINARAEDWVSWCCQTNANQSQFSSDLNLLGCAETAPLAESGGTVKLEA
jgi:hypothetical protein